MPRPIWFSVCRELLPEGIEPSTRFFRETCSATELREHRCTLPYVLRLQPCPCLLVQGLQLRHGAMRREHVGLLRSRSPGRGVIGGNPAVLDDDPLLQESFAAALDQMHRFNRIGKFLGMGDSRVVLMAQLLKRRSQRQESGSDAQYSTQAFESAAEQLFNAQLKV